jgi:hypothetical protein
MKKALLVALLLLTVIGSYAMAEEVRDWRDLHKVHEHIKEAIHEMERARAANHYDMAGHGAKAEEFLHKAEHELQEAVEDAKRAR